MTPMSDDFSARLRSIVGADHVWIDDESRERGSFDAIDPRRLMDCATAIEARIDAVVCPVDTVASQSCLEVLERSYVLERRCFRSEIHKHALAVNPPLPAISDVSKWFHTKRSIT